LGSSTPTPNSQIFLLIFKKSTAFLLRTRHNRNAALKKKR